MPYCRLMKRAMAPGLSKCCPRPCVAASSALWLRSQRVSGMPRLMAPASSRRAFTQRSLCAPVGWFLVKKRLDRVVRISAVCDDAERPSYVHDCAGYGQNPSAMGRLRQSARWSVKGLPWMGHTAPRSSRANWGASATAICGNRGCCVLPAGRHVFGDMAHLLTDWRFAVVGRHAAGGAKTGRISWVFCWSAFAPRAAIHLVFHLA